MIIRWCKGVHGQDQGRKRHDKIVNSKIAKELWSGAECRVSRTNANSETRRATTFRYVPHRYSRARSKTYERSAVAQRVKPQHVIRPFGVSRPVASA